MLSDPLFDPSSANQLQPLPQNLYALESIRGAPFSANPYPIDRDIGGRDGSSDSSDISTSSDIPTIVLFWRPTDPVSVRACKVRVCVL